MRRDEGDGIGARGAWGIREGWAGRIIITYQSVLSFRRKFLRGSIRYTDPDANNNKRTFLFTAPYLGSLLAAFVLYRLIYFSSPIGRFCSSL